MSKKFAQLPEDMQEALATGAGIVLKEFDPSNPGEDSAIRANILFATTGGVNPVCVATITDFGEDIDNCPKNTKELAQIEGWDCSMSGTAITVNGDILRSLLGAADKTTGSDDLNTITPRMKFNLNTDFPKLWYVCPYGTQHGFIAIELNNALSTGGLSLQSGDKAKGQWAFSYKGYTSIDTPDVVPMKFYLKASASASAVNVEPTVNN